MPVDTTMYARPAQSNPLEMLSSVAGIGNQLQQNRLIGTEMGARQAVGEAAQGATGADGTFDPNAFSATVAHDPRAAFEAANAMAFAQQQRQAQLEMAKSKLGAFNTTVAGLLAKPGVTSKDVTSAAGDLVAGGIMDAKMVAGQLASMPADQTQMVPWLKQHLVRGMDAQSQVEALIGTPKPVNTGAETQFVRTPAMGETPAPLQNTLSPEGAAAPVAGPVDESGAPTTVPLGQRVGMGVVKTGLSPAEGAAQTVHGGGVAQDALAFENAARTTPDMAAALKNMTGDLKELSTGPGSHNRNSFMAAVNSFMGTGFDAEKVATQEGFDKLAAQVSARQRQMLGMSNTDAQTNIMAGASPGSQLSKLGNANQIAIIKGNNDALSAENRAWEAYKASGKGSETFHQFTTVFNKHVDPLVFQMQYMTDPQKKALVSALSAAEKDRLAASLAFARHNGLLGK
jgi:hypothetical protein